MIDAITYIADVTLLTECAMFKPDEAGNLHFQGAKTPTHRKGNETLALVRVNDLNELSGCNITVLASCEAGGLAVYTALAADAVAQTKYDSVYDQSEVTYEDEGITKTYTPSPYIGCFA
jgi:hypothetical protein